MNSREPVPTVLVVDDEPEFADYVGNVAEMAGFAPVLVTDGNAFKRAFNHDFTVIVLDLAIPGTDGVELIRYLANADCTASIILLSGFDIHVLNATCELAQARGLSVLGALSKPANINELEQMLTQAKSVAPSPERGAAPRLSYEDLLSAIDMEQLCVHYQPKVGLQTGTLVGVEALVRWNHPEHGLLGPGRFIPLAVETGLIDELTMVVADRALQDIKTWDSLMVNVPKVALNLETSSLRDIALPERILGLLDQHGVNANRLMFEVTERDAIEDLADALDVLTRLRLRGIKLSIDDFGTGHSTVRQLARIPFSEFKIDKSFVDTLGQTTFNETVFRSMVNMGHDLALDVVAEGVESPDQLELLKRLGCDTAQGYHFSPPVPADEIAAFTRPDVVSRFYGGQATTGLTHMAV